MAQYANVTMTFVGSHAGVSIGEDGASQMGLEDIALFRGLLGSTVLYPSDATSADKLVEVAAHNTGLTYIRTTRRDTPVLYRSDELFTVGGSKTLRSSTADVATIVSVGVTLHEALKAYEELRKQGIVVRVIDAYSVKPLDVVTLEKAVRDTGKVLVVEDHFAEGGLGEAVKSLFASSGAQFEHLAVIKTPHSGTSDELLALAGIDALAIVASVKKLVA
jgi:transketolase